MTSSMETAREALEKAQKTFSHYAGLHKLKGTIEGDNKARKNAELADEMRQALAALSRGEAAGCVMADEPGKCVNPACREDGACARTHHSEAGAPSRAAIARKIAELALGVAWDSLPTDRADWRRRFRGTSVAEPGAHQDELLQAADAILALFPTPPDKAGLGGMGERVARIASDMNLVLSQAWDEEQDRDWGAATDELKLDRLDELLGNLLALLSERPAAEGWRKHDGETQPVADDYLVDIEFSDGSVEHLTSAGHWEWNDLLAAPQVVRWKPSPLPANPALPQDVETKEGDAK